MPSAPKTPIIGTLPMKDHVTAAGGIPPRQTNYNPGPPVQSGAGQHGALAGNAGRVAALPGHMTPEQVRSMQQFLNNHGFQVSQDGMWGPQTKSAAAAFRANHKGGDAWNKANGIGTHPANRVDPGLSPHDGTDPGKVTPGHGKGGGGGGGGGNPPPTDPFQALLAQLLGQGGTTGVEYDPRSFGDAAAAPDTAAAAALARQAALNPKQTAQDQADISNWYGLDPKAKSYALSVLGKLGQAKSSDAAATTAVEGNMGDLAQALAGSIGGAANDGSGSVLAAGANAAGTTAALGQAQSDYESNMDPLLRAEAAGAASKDKATQGQALLDLQDKLAAAQGQAKADRATGIMTATDKNNALGQQRFANQGNLLSVLAQQEATDPNANPLKDALTQAKIKEVGAQTSAANARAAYLQAGGSRGVPKQVTKLNLSAAYSALKQVSGGSLTPGSAIPTGQHAALANNIATVLQSMGITKSNPLYKSMGDQMFGSFVDQHGQPLQAPPGWGI